MNAFNIQSVFISSKKEIGECYMVIGSYVGKVRSLSSKSDYVQVLQEANISLDGLQGGLELWQYQPHKLIKIWKIPPKIEESSQNGWIYQDQIWQILLKIRTLTVKSPNPKQITRHESLKEFSTRSSSRSKEKKYKNMAQIKQALKQKINILTVKPKSKPKNKDHYNAYYSNYSSKYPSFFTSFANTQNEIYQSCLDYCAQNQQQKLYNKQAQNIYGLNRPKQGKQKHMSKHRFHSKAPHNMG